MPFGVEEIAGLEHTLEALNQNANTSSIIMLLLVIVLFSLPFLWRWVMRRETRLSEAQKFEQEKEKRQQEKVVDALVLVRDSLGQILEMSKAANSQAAANHSAAERSVEVLDRLVEIQASILAAQRETSSTIRRVETIAQGVQDQQHTFEDLLKVLKGELFKLVEIVLLLRDGSLDKDMVMAMLRKIDVGVDTIAGDVHHIRAIVDTQEMEAVRLPAPSDILIKAKQEQLNPDG